MGNIIRGRKFAIIISCFDFYEMRVKFIDEFLQKKNYKTWMLFSDFDHYQKKTSRKWECISNVNYISTIPYYKNLSLRRLVSHFVFAKNACRFVKEKQPDFVYVLIPPNSLVKEIVKLKRKLGFKLILDVIDLWPESLPGAKTTLPPFSTWKNMRDNFINEADCIFIECKRYEEVLEKNIKDKKIHLLYPIKPPLKNGFISSIENGGSVIRLCYLGTVNNLIDIPGICRFVKVCCGKYSVEVRIIGYGEKLEEFIQQLEEAGAAVENYGLVYDAARKAEIMKDCHFGINMYKNSLKVGLTLKSIDYFQYGLPILNSISGDTEEMVNHNKIGLNLFDINRDCMNGIREYIENANDYRKNVLAFYDETFNSNFIEEKLYSLEEYV